MIWILKENFILHRYKQLAVAEISKENTEKKINEFFKQIKSDDTTFIFSTFKTVAFNKFKVIIFSNEKNENENKNDNDDWIINDTE